MIDNCVADAIDLAYQLEAADTLEGYRGAQKIRALLTRYEIKERDSEVWHEYWKAEHTDNKELRKRLALFTSTPARRTAEIELMKALPGCKYCKQCNAARPYCHACLKFIVKRAVNLFEKI